MASPAKAGGERHATDGQGPSARVPASLFAKLAAVMGEVGFVEKRGRNQFHGYEYATETDVLTAVREKLAARNVALIPSVQSVDERPYTTAKGKESVVTTARMEFTFADGDSGETFRVEWAGQGDDPADKGLYKALTGGLKYFLMKTFLIPTGDDPEGDRSTDQRAGDRQAAQPVQLQKPPLNDPKAKQLRRDAETAFKALNAKDPEKYPQRIFDRWLAHAESSHDELERLVRYLDEQVKEVGA